MAVAERTKVPPGNLPLPFSTTRLLGTRAKALIPVGLEALFVQVVRKSPWSSVIGVTSQVATKQGKKQHETSPPKKTQHNQTQHKPKGKRSNL